MPARLLVKEESAVKEHEPERLSELRPGASVLVMVSMVAATLGTAVHFKRRGWL